MSTSAPDRRFSILLISDSYPPVLGGSEIEAQRVCRALIERGHRVQVLCSGGPPMPPQREWIDPVGVPVTILTRRARGRWKDIVFALGVAVTIWRRRKATDVVYFLMQGLHLAAGLPAARLAGKPIVMKISGSGVIPLMRRSFAGRLELRWLRKWAAQVMVLNDGMVEEAKTDGFLLRQLTLMPNPVDIDEFRPARAGEASVWRRDHAIPEHAAVVIYVGRLSHEKGLPELLRGFAQASRNAGEAVLLLVGDGPMRPELETLVNDLGLSRESVRFVGRVPVNDVTQWLHASDVFALTSPSEGFSCALLEAMAAGLAPVVSDIPANLQLVVPEVNGLVVADRGERSVGDALLRLLRDPQLRVRLGAAARQRVVANFSTDRVVERYEALFGKIMDRPDSE